MKGGLKDDPSLPRLVGGGFPKKTSSLLRLNPPIRNSNSISIFLSVFDIEAAGRLVRPPSFVFSKSHPFPLSRKVRTSPLRRAFLSNGNCIWRTGLGRPRFFSGVAAVPPPFFSPGCPRGSFGEGCFPPPRDDRLASLLLPPRTKNSLSSTDAAPMRNRGPIVLPLRPHVGERSQSAPTANSAKMSFFFN